MVAYSRFKGICAFELVYIAAACTCADKAETEVSAL